MAKGPGLWPSAAAGIALCLAVGCNSNTFKIPTTSQLNGNWSFTSQTPTANATQISLNAGITSQSNGSLSAVAHLTGSSCVSAQTAIVLSGSVNSDNQLSMTSEPFAGTTLVLKGQVATDGKSIANSSWSFTGGSCASLGKSQVIGTDYSDISGTYTGVFTDVSNNQLPVTAVLTQTTQPDQNGQFHLSGSATFPNNPCFTQPIVTDSLVTGNSASTTYSQGGASITATGTFNSGATQLTVTNWQVSGGECDGDSGTGTLTEQ